MGVSRSTGEFLRKMDLFPKALAKANQDAANRIGLQAKQTLLSAAQGDNAGKLTMRNFGKSGIKLGVRYKVDGPPEKKVIEVKPSTGRIGWRVLQGGAKPHVITSRYAGGSRKSRAQRVEGGQKLLRGGGRGGRAVLRTPAGYRRWVRHPGVKARKTWTRGTDQVVKTIAVKEYREQVRAALGRVFP